MTISAGPYNDTPAAGTSVGPRGPQRSRAGRHRYHPLEGCCAKDLTVDVYPDGRQDWGQRCVDELRWYECHLIAGGMHDSSSFGYQSHTAWRRRSEVTS